MSTTISINCWIISEDSGHIFLVELQATKTVGALKRALKEENKQALQHIDANNLVLWKVSLPADEDLDEKLEKLNLDDKHPLRPLMKLSSLFADQLVDNHLPTYSTKNQGRGPSR